MSGEALEKSTVAEDETDFEAAFNEHAEAKEIVEDDPTDIIEKEDDKFDEKNQDGEPGDEDLDKVAKKDDEEEDPYAGMSEATKTRVQAIEEENKNLNHRLNSDAGRVSAFQRKINGMEKEIQSIRSGGTAGEQPDKAQIAEAMGGTDEEWESFKDDYPEVAKAIDSRLDKAGKATQETLDSTLAPVKARQEHDAQKAVEDATQAATDIVSDTYPSWTEAVQKPEFALWLDTQPPGVQSLSDSDDPQDASALIGLYDGHLVANGQPTLKADPKDNDGVDTEETTAQEEETNSVAARRKQQLEDGTTIPSRNSRVDPSKEPVDDFEAAFAYHAKRKDRQRQRA